MILPSLCSADTYNPRFLEQVQRKRVDAFLVDEDEALLFTTAGLFFKLDNLLHFIISELPLSGHLFFTFFSITVEESRIDLAT